MRRLLLVSLGGAVGTGARYLLGGLITTAVGPGFPWGTLTINATGSFVMAGVMYLGLDVGILSHDLRTVLAVGVLGGFTTYSSFNHETLSLLQRGAWGHALGYASSTFLGCLLAGVLGLALARGIAGPW